MFDLLDSNDSFLERLSHANVRYHCIFKGSGEQREDELVRSFREEVEQQGDLPRGETSLFICARGSEGVVTRRMPYNIIVVPPDRNGNPDNTTLEITVSGIPSQKLVTDIDREIEKCTRALGGDFKNKTASLSIGS